MATLRTSRWRRTAPVGQVTQEQYERTSLYEVLQIAGWNCCLIWISTLSLTGSWNHHEDAANSVSQSSPVTLIGVQLLLFPVIWEFIVFLLVICNTLLLEWNLDFSIFLPMQAMWPNCGSVSSGPNRLKNKMPGVTVAAGMTPALYGSLREVTLDVECSFCEAQTSLWPQRVRQLDAYRTDFWHLPIPSSCGYVPA